MRPFKRRREAPPIHEQNPPPEETADDTVEGDTLIAVPSQIVRADAEQFVAVVVEDGRTERLSSVEVSVVLASSSPVSSDALIERLAGSGWDRSALDDVPSILESLVSRGLVVDFERWISGYSDSRDQGPRSEPNGSSPLISAIAIPTRDRPAMVDRALAAWMENRADRYAPDLVIADDSLHSTVEVRSVVENCASRYRGRVFLLDSAYRAALLERLPRAAGRCFGITDRALSTSSEVSTGANRNLILLALCGRAFMMVDDDMLPVYREFLTVEPGLAVNTGPERSVFQPARNISECEMLGSPSVRDGFSIHGDLLGRSCRGLIAGTRPLSLSPVDPDFLTRFLSEESRIAAVASSYWGDLGMSAPRYLLDARSCVDSVSYDDEKSYHHHIASAVGMRGFSVTTIGNGSFLGGQASFDARRTIPPFSPRGRNQDGLWSVCLSVLHPHSVTAYPNISIQHDPERPRAVERDAVIRWTPRLNDLIILLLDSLSRGCSPNDDRYSLLGSRMATLAGGPRNVFRSLLAEIAAQAIVGRIGILEREYNRYDGEPEFWGEDCIAAIEYGKARLDAPNFWMPADGPDTENELAEYIREFGESLTMWPEIFTSAASFSEDLLESARVR